MRILTTTIAIAVGLLVLLGYFFPQASVFQLILLDWAILFSGVAAWVGIFNLVMVHADKVRRNAKDSVYSAILILGLLVTFTFGLILKPQHPYMQAFILNGIIIPVEAALLGVLTVTLLYAAIRLLRRRSDVMAIVFIFTAAIIFLGSVTLPLGDIPILGTLIRPWVSQIWALGGARGILIGVALGALTTGLRALFGVDRPYGGA
ncbi:MAG: hypothetical protein HXY38_06295 [Chloroflexi bacterium]|nr:hypothetical protein [Chloroflexota bacterium]